VDYASAPPGGAGKPITAIGLTVLLSFIYIFMLVMAIFVAPRMETTFREFDAELPGITVIFLGICRWIRSYYGWAMLLPLPIVVPMLVTHLTWRPGTQRQRGLRIFGTLGITFILLTIFVLFAVLSLFLPMVRLIDAASAPAR
jgi:type II secretory pathway component PulF